VRCIYISQSINYFFGKVFALRFQLPNSFVALPLLTIFKLIFNIMLVRQCLIIEDDDSSIQDLQRNLNKLPFFQVVEVCKNYAEAINALNSQTFDVVFLDIELGNDPSGSLTGLDILRNLPKAPPLLWCPITLSMP
jgi:Response regulator receiver domain